MEQIKHDKALLRFFPEKIDLCKPLSRKWALCVFATLKPRLAERLVNEAIKKRNKMAVGKNKDPGITPEQLKLLAKYPWKS